MTSPRHTKLAILTLTAAIGVTGLGLTPIASHATTPSPMTIASTHHSSNTFGGLTAIQWRAVANTARAAGDAPAAQAAGEAAGRADGIATRSRSALATAQWIVFFLI